MSDKKLTEKDIEKLATEIKDYLIKYDMWDYTRIYFNEKCYDSEKKEIIENIYPEEYFEYVASDHILSMSFEGTLYEILNYYIDLPKTLEEFNNIFKKYGVYYELGNAWNLTCYYI